MALSAEAKAEMLRETHEAALVLVDDLEHIRSVLAKDFPTAGDVRRLCAQLRRILLDREITAVAAPRVGKLTFRVPFSPMLEKAANRGDCVFASATIPHFFGMQHQGIVSFMRAPTGDLRDRTMAEAHLRLDNFLADKVAWAEGQWITRADVLKFVAYHGQGVHFRGRKEAIFDLIERHKHTVNMFVDHDAKMVTTDLNTPGKPLEPACRARARQGVGLPSLHMFGTAKYLVESPDVIALEEIIRNEGDLAA